MLQIVEKIILELIRGFFSLPWIVGLATFGAASIVLLIIQFMQRGDRFAPGIFGGIFGYIAFMHVTQRERVIEKMSELLSGMQALGGGIRPVPILEPLFHILVGPAAHRHFYEEIIGVFLVVYLGIVAKISLAGYKKNGNLFEKVSLKSFFGEARRRPTRSRSN